MKKTILAEGMRQFWILVAVIGYLLIFFFCLDSLNSFCFLSLVPIVPIKTYSNAETNKEKILKENKKSGHEISKLSHVSTEFLQWFTGFTDASLIQKSIRQFSTKSSNTNNTNLSLVIWGTNLISTVGTGRFKKQVSNMIKLAPYQYNVIIGLLLSDGWLILASKTSKNARLGFKQSLEHSEYVLFVFNILSHYCSSSPRVRTGIRAGNRNYALEFFTRSMPCLTELHSLFYPNGVKIVPHNIYELLTPIALAHLIMGDGSVSQHGLIICTDSYSIEDTVRLINVLIIKFRLECSLLAWQKNQYRIYIKQGSMPSLLNIVSPFMHSSMLYKLKSALSNPSNRNKIEVFDKDTNQTTYYDSINKAAIALNCNNTSILYNIKSTKQKPYKGRYIFKLL